MNVLFLSIIDIPENTISNSGLYTDLLREFYQKGHNVYVACGTEKRNRVSNAAVLSEDCGIKVLHVPIGNVQQTNYLEKGINTVRLPAQFTKQINTFFRGVQFDLILFATPPVTLCKTVKKLKKKNNAQVFLLLKDMWPEGISSLGVIKHGGIIYRYFERKEKAMYKVSDFVGCMSEACVQYLYKHHPQIPRNSICVCPNSLAPLDLSETRAEKDSIRMKYGLPKDKILVVYGGNLGRAQGVDFLIENLKKKHNEDKIHFVVIGSGLEYHKLKNYVESSNNKSVVLFEKLPRDQYCKLMAATDIGMILLNSKLTVPNTPSRMLDYLLAKLPVLACVDGVTDIGDTIEDNGFGWKCASNDYEQFKHVMKRIIDAEADFEAMGENGYDYFLNHYTAEIAYNTIIKAVSSK